MHLLSSASLSFNLVSHRPEMVADFTKAEPSVGRESRRRHSDPRRAGTYPFAVQPTHKPCTPCRSRRRPCADPPPIHRRWTSPARWRKHRDGDHPTAQGGHVLGLRIRSLITVGFPFREGPFIFGLFGFLYLGLSKDFPTR